MTEAEQEAARASWAEAMGKLAGSLYNRRSTEPQFAFGLTARELPNFLAALEHRAKIADTEEVIAFATVIEDLAQLLGHAKAVAQAARIRTALAERLGAWNHAAFLAEDAAI